MIRTRQIGDHTCHRTIHNLSHLITSDDSPVVNEFPTMHSHKFLSIGLALKRTTHNQSNVLQYLKRLNKLRNTALSGHCTNIANSAGSWLFLLMIWQLKFFHYGKIVDIDAIRINEFETFGNKGGSADNRIQSLCYKVFK